MTPAYGPPRSVLSILEQIGGAILGAIIVESLGRGSQDRDAILSLARFLFAR